MLIGGIALGLVLGLLVGGSVMNLASIRLHRLLLLLVAVIVRFGTEFLLNANVPLADTLRVPLLGASFALLLVALWANRALPGHEPRLHRGAGQRRRHPGQRRLHADLPAEPPRSPASTRPTWQPCRRSTRSCRRALDANFLLHLGPFADVIPIPFPIVQNVASIGDVFLTLGLAFFLFAAVVRVPQELDDAELAAIRERLDALAASGRPLRAGDPGEPRPACHRPSPGPSPCERPLVLGGAGTGMASPLALSTYRQRRRGRRPRLASRSRSPAAHPEAVERVRQHPYVRLALNGSFSALWAGQLISLFGDRLNQIALVAVVLRSRPAPPSQPVSCSSSATLPNLILSPDRRHVRRSLGSQGGHGRQRHPPGRDRPDPADRRGHQHRPGLPADLPRHDDLGLLPAGARRDPAADRPARRTC